jgi:hypothetical protein
LLVRDAGVALEARWDRCSVTARVDVHRESPRGWMFTVTTRVDGSPRVDVRSHHTDRWFESIVEENVLGNGALWQAEIVRECPHRRTCVGNPNSS